MDEGVDLTAATDVVHLTLPYTPSTFEQRNRRSQRIGEVQKDYANVHVIKPVLDEFTPVITEGIEKLLDDKRRIITYILKQPFDLTKEDIEEIKNGGAKSSKHIAPLISSPARAIFSHLGQLKAQGYNKILSHYERFPEEAEFIARLYASHWEGYYAGNTATLYANVIKILEEKEDLERKLDIASGPFSLSRRLARPVTNLDINNYMLNAGRLLEKEGKIVSGNTAVQGTFHQLPFDNGSFNLTVCSLAMHMSRLKVNYKGRDIKERELALREANRVLRENGYAVITLPHTVISESDLTNFYKALNQLGFEVLQFSGFYKSLDSKFNVYLAGLRKVREPYNGDLDGNLLTWKMDKQLGRNKRISSRKRKHVMSETKEIVPKIVEQFYHTRSRKSLEDEVRGVL